MDFVHLHLHSEYSLLDGACRISDIPKRAKALGQKAVAITDHGAMYGAVAFYNACKKEGVKPIVGCEVYVAPNSRFDRDGRRDFSGNHLVLLVKDKEGYQNLIYLVSKAFTEGFYSKPRIDMELLRSHSRGLVALSACLAGRIPRSITAGDYDGALKHATELDSIFGRGNFYLEMQDHHLPDQSRVNDGLREISAKTGIPLVCTNDVHYLNRQDSELHAVLMCIQTNNVLSNGAPIGFETDEFYFKSAEEMAILFPQDSAAIENTAKIADMCNFDFDFDSLYLPTFKPQSGESPAKMLERVTFEGLELRREKYGLAEGFSEQDYIDRANYELSVIEKMGFCEYYLVVRDYIAFAKSKNIPVGPGRGSGAGSLVACLVGITDVDPLKYDLLFERFLNPERTSMPDFDVDFCYDRRDEVLDYVVSKYGRDRVSQIATFGTLAARAAVRDVGRALGMPYSDVDAISKLIPNEFNITLESALRSKALSELYANDEKARRLLDFAKKVEGMPRHISTHAAGVIITDRPIYEYVPLATTGEAVVTQYDMDMSAKLGLVKFDFLALRYLTIIDDAVREIKLTDPNFDIEKISFDDPDTFDLISSGRTDGIFQLESSGMKQFLTQFRPRNLEDIIAVLALYRPGPMEDIPRYLAARQSGSYEKSGIEALDAILAPTYGVIIYQEQVMRIFCEIAGYSLGRADIVRRAMSKKKHDVMEAERENFVEGASARGISRDAAQKLFDDMTSFASYAFNKSHAAAYAMISYRTAYLKKHYMTAYMSALLTSVLGNFGKTAQYISECEKAGIKVLPPDINKSKKVFSSDGANIRYGLLAVKNVGVKYVEELVLERETKPYSSPVDFIKRMCARDSNRKQLESLIKCGALDSFGVGRSSLMAGYEKLCDMFVAQNRENVTGQIDLFSMGNAGLNSDEESFVFPSVAEFSVKERLMLEKESSGMYFSGHLLDEYSRDESACECSSAAAITSDEGARDGERVKICGIVTRRQNKTTRSGAAMAFITLEDRTAEIEVIVFSGKLENTGWMLSVDSAVLIEGTVSLREDEEPKILLSDCRPLVPNDVYDSVDESAKRTCFGRGQTRAETKQSTAVSAQRTASLDAQNKKSANNSGLHENQNRIGGTLYIKVPSIDSKEGKRARALSEIFEGDTEVVFYEDQSGKYVKAVGLRVSVTSFLLSELEELLGEGNVVYRQ